MSTTKLEDIEKKINTIVSAYSGNPINTVGELLALKGEAEACEAESQAQCYRTISIIYENIGNVWLEAKKIPEAEKAYFNMCKYVNMLYNTDKEKYDLLFGTAICKRASFYKSAFFGPVNFSSQPAKLSEQQQKVFKVTEESFRSAIACTMKKAKEGSLRYVDFQCEVLNELMEIYFLAGDYKQAVSCGADCINLEQAIYNAKHDFPHAYRFAVRLGNFACIGNILKNPQIVTTALKKLIDVLSEYEDEDEDAPEINYMIGMAYLTVASFYRSSPEHSLDEADTAALRGFEKMLEANVLSGNKYVSAIISAAFRLGDQYMDYKDMDGAWKFYDIAQTLAEEEYERTGDPKIGKIIDLLEERKSKT